MATRDPSCLDHHAQIPDVCRMTCPPVCPCDLCWQAADVYALPGCECVDCGRAQATLVASVEAHRVDYCAACGRARHIRRSEPGERLCGRCAAVTRCAVCLRARPMAGEPDGDGDVCWGCREPAAEPEPDVAAWGW